MNETARDRSPQSLENEIIALTHRLKCLRPALSPSMDGLTPMGGSCPCASVLRR